MPTECPPDKIINPATGRCVLKTGKIGRTILQTPCPPDKVRNPTTKRCVKKTGAIGKTLQQKPMVQSFAFFDNISWNMTGNSPSKTWKTDIEFNDEDGTSRPLTQKEWSMVVYPNHDWTLGWEFPDSDDEYIRGKIKFTKKATVRDVFQAIAKLPFRYGWFEGIGPATYGAKPHEFWISVGS